MAVLSPCDAASASWWTRSSIVCTIVSWVAAILSELLHRFLSLDGQLVETNSHLRAS